LTVELFFWALYQSGAKCPWEDSEMILLIGKDLILETDYQLLNMKN